MFHHEDPNHVHPDTRRDLAAPSRANAPHHQNARAVSPPCAGAPAANRSSAGRRDGTGLHPHSRILTDAQGAAVLFRLEALAQTERSDGRVHHAATLCFDLDSFRIEWESSQHTTDCRLGDLVRLRYVPSTFSGANGDQCHALEAVRQPISGTDPFRTVPESWCPHRILLQRASRRWQQLPRPLADAVTALLWEPASLKALVSSPAFLRFGIDVPVSAPDSRIERVVLGLLGLAAMEGEGA